MLRTHHCGELRAAHIGQDVTLCGWVKKIRDKGSIIWIDLGDRFGITQITLEEGVTDSQLIDTVKGLGREFVVCIRGKVHERISKNDKIATGDIEIRPENLEVLNPSLLPPFLIEDDTDGQEELRMKYRYLDLRRHVVRKNLELRHRIAQEVRKYLNGLDFLEVETPVLIKSTPEGARDFVVPSRVHEGEFYALPQSPQTFKQLLMVSGFDRYYQIVKCFRDEDLRADRQPEFTQIDCEMSFVEQEDILQVFEGLVRYIFKSVKDIDLLPLPRMSWDEAMHSYGSDKPDTRFDMRFFYLEDLTQGKGFQVFDQAETVVGICAKGAASYTRKDLDELTEFVKRPQVGAKGLVWVKFNTDGTLKSSVDKFFSENDLRSWCEKAGASEGDLLLILAGEKSQTLKALSELRLETAERLGLRDRNTFSALWVLDFPLLEQGDDPDRWHAVHHPFTAPKPEDTHLLQTKPGDVRANAYDMVINGTEIGGGSIRIYQKELQEQMFNLLGFTKQESLAQFGFLMNAFEYGTPPHGGIAFGFDRLCALFGGVDSIRDFIAFPKNNAGRDVMIDSPSPISTEQLAELHIKL